MQSSRFSIFLKLFVSVLCHAQFHLWNLTLHCLCWHLISLTVSYQMKFQVCAVILVQWWNPHGFSGRVSHRAPVSTSDTRRGVISSVCCGLGAVWLTCQDFCSQGENGTCFYLSLYLSQSGHHLCDPPKFIGRSWFSIYMICNRYSGYRTEINHYFIIHWLSEMFLFAQFSPNIGSNIVQIASFVYHTVQNPDHCTSTHHHLS